MKATLMWTINDFPAYGMLFGWSTHGKFACPYCMGDIKSFTLKSGGKPCWFDCHRQFLPINHSFHRDQCSYKKSVVEKSVVEKSLPPQEFSGMDVINQVNQLQKVTFGLKSSKQKQPDFGKTHNWVKKSIFWELPYWSTNMVRHNLDVMHVEICGVEIGLKSTF